jgi:hypothetical protein
MPEGYPLYQTYHRRFQQWDHKEVMDAILRTLAQDLKNHGDLDLSGCFKDGTFVVSNKGALVWEILSGQRFEAY